MDTMNGLSCDFALCPNDGKKIASLNNEKILSLFKEQHMVWFRGFQTDLEDFDTLCNNFCTDFSDYKGGGSRWKAINREIVNNDKTLLTATGTIQNFAIPLHGEMYYMNNPPELIFFYCQTPPEKGGQTIVCNGAELFKLLNDNTRHFFLSNNIKYIRHLADQDWQIAFMLNDFSSLQEFCTQKGMTVAYGQNNSVIIEYVCSPVVFNESKVQHVFINNIPYIYFAEKAFSGNTELVNKIGQGNVNCPMVVRMENGEPVPEQYIENVMTVAAGITHSIDWQKGDIVMLDNTIMMHGRKKTSGDNTERKLLVKMGRPLFNF